MKQIESVEIKLFEKTSSEREREREQESGAEMGSKEYRRRQCI